MKARSLAVTVALDILAVIGAVSIVGRIVDSVSSLHISSYSPADYVRDPWHECKRDSSPNFDENTRHVGSDGTVYTTWGWKTCEGGVRAVIGNEEEQL